MFHGRSQVGHIKIQVQMIPLVLIKLNNIQSDGISRLRSADRKMQEVLHKFERIYLWTQSGTGSSADLYLTL